MRSRGQEMDRPEAGERRGCVSSGGDAGGDVRADVSAFGGAHLRG